MLEAEIFTTFSLVRPKLPARGWLPGEKKHNYIFYYSRTNLSAFQHPSGFCIIIGCLIWRLLCVALLGKVPALLL
jgi:hypothetical protein